MRTRVLFAATCLAVLAGCLGPRLSSEPGVYTVTVQPVHTLGREIDAVYVRPVQDRHPGYLVVFATGDDLRDGIGGAVAIALTREADYLHAPKDDPDSRVQVDDQGRIQLYPALKFMGSSRLAVIQSTNDDYAPAAESRQLLGADTPSLRLYTVVATVAPNH